MCGEIVVGQQVTEHSSDVHEFLLSLLIILIFSNTLRVSIQSFSTIINTLLIVVSTVPITKSISTIKFIYKYSSMYYITFYSFLLCSK